MHQGEPQVQGWTPIKDTKIAANVLMLAAQAIAAPLEPILRHSFGKHYFGVPHAIGFFVMPLWYLMFPRDDPTPLVGLWLIYLAFQLLARVGTMLPRRARIHSRYNGRPWLAWVLRRVPEESIKLTAEPALVIIAGLFCFAYSEPLGSYLMAAGVCLCMVASTIQALHRARAVQLHDQWIEQRQLAEAFRRLQRGEGL